MSPTSTRPADAPSTRHAGLERDDIVEAALEMVEAGGGDALTMRKIAAHLGVAPTTIYWHVGNRDELVLAVIQRQAERQAATRVTGRSPRARIVSATRNIWDNALAHRNVTALASQVGATTLLELPLEQALVAELERAGLVGADARDALRALLACVAGFLVMAWRSDERVPPALRNDALWAAEGRHEIGAATRAALCEPADVEALFERTVRAIVGDLVAAAASERTQR